MTTGAQTQRGIYLRGGSNWRDNWREEIGTWLIYALLISGALVMIFPFIWMFLTSFKTVQESNLYPPTILPREWYP